VPDTLDIQQITSSKQYTSTAAFQYGYDATIENNTSAAYYVIQTKTFFSTASVNIGERIVIQNLFWGVPASTATIGQNQIAALTSYFQQATGLLVVAIGYTTSSVAPGISTGSNSQGYCNYMIVRGIFADPITGSVVTQAIAGTADTSAGSTPTANTPTAFLSQTVCVSGRLLNQSHQVQVALRVITREMDSTSVIRPDNL
jgi:hypothetical protein